MRAIPYLNMLELVPETPLEGQLLAKWGMEQVSSRVVARLEELNYGAVLQLEFSAKPAVYRSPAASMGPVELDKEAVAQQLDHPRELQW